MKTLLRSSAARLSVAAAGLTFLLTFEFLRAWAVSMPLFYEGFLHLPTPALILVAFSPFVVALLAAPLFTWRRPPAAALAVVAAASRMVLQFVGPGLPRLVAVLVGLAACLMLLVAMAPWRHTVAALVGALAADAVLLMVLQTESLVFRNGPGAAAAAGALCAALVALVVLSTPERGTAVARAGAAAGALPPRNAVLPWLGFGPVLALHLTVASLPAPVEVATGWQSAAARGVIAGSYVVGAAIGLWALQLAPKHRRSRFAPFAVAAVALAAGFLALFAQSGDWVVLAAVLLPIGLLVGLASLARLPGPTSRLAARVAAGAALLAGVAVPIVYYLGFIYRYPVSAVWLLAATAGVFAVLLVLAGLFARPAAVRVEVQPEPRPGAEPHPAPLALPHVALPIGGGSLRGRSRWVIGVAAVVVSFLLAAPALGGNRSTDHSPLNGFPVRIASYNIFMGLGADVNLDLDRLARGIQSEKPDVIALQEVSRGWFTSGNVDILPRIAERLGYSYRFFPAADQTWGNAILTNLPSAGTVHGFLPQGISAMRRGWGGEVLELGDGRRLFFVVTHLYNPPDGHELRAKQAEELVKRTVDLADHYHLVDMTVIVGDLNAESDSSELTSLREVYTDLLTHLDPAPTYPSWAPYQRIDHVFASNGLVGSYPATFGGLASDHLGVALTLRPAQ